MLIILALLIALLPAVVVLYPLLQRDSPQIPLPDESSAEAELDRRWQEAVASLMNTELEWSLGNLNDEDYQSLREQYFSEAALVLKAKDLELAAQADLLSELEGELPDDHVTR